jgi:hypothetical protein
MTPGKDQIVLHASEGFKDALGKYAADTKSSMAEVIRQAVASVIGYDLKADPARTRAPKYATKEEATRAALDRAALIRWGNKTSGRLLVGGDIESASVIARAVAQKDYETLELLKDAAETPDEVEADEEIADEDFVADDAEDDDAE